MPQADKPATTPSLPGKLATRTDGGIASKQSARYIAGMPNYGDGQDLMNLQAQAPMAAEPAVLSPELGAGIAAKQQMPDLSTLPSLTGPSTRPWEHVATPHPVQTSGDVQGQYQSANQLFQVMAAKPDASPTMKYLAQRIGQAF